jgi:hypothetical protein
MNQPRDAQARDAVAAPVVNSMPVFNYPFMLASMPMMPVAVQQQQPQSRDAEPTRGDCCDRVSQLEKEMIRLQTSVANLQILMEGQNEILQKLSEAHKNK